MIYDLQKASMTKRLSACLLDFFVLCLIAVGVMALVYDLVGYDAKAAELQTYYDEYEEKYGISTDISSEEYNALSEADRAKYDAASEAFGRDERVLNSYSILINLTIVITSFSILVSYIVTDIVFPLFFKNGQTLGKKIFNIAVMRTDGVKISGFQLFVRAILGKFTIETMVPVLLIMMTLFGIMGSVAVIVVVLLLILEIAVMVITKTNSAIHDLFAVTVTVDLESQKIFDSEADLIEYKKMIAEKKAQESPY